MTPVSLRVLRVRVTLSVPWDTHEAREQKTAHDSRGSIAMNEITCPSCQAAFKIDEAGYADILKQVRDGEFKQELDDRLALAEKDKQSAVELAKAKVTGELQKTAAVKDAEITGLKAKLDSCEVTQKLAV